MTHSGGATQAPTRASGDSTCEVRRLHIHWNEEVIILRKGCGMRRFIYSTVIGVAVLGLGWAANIGAQPFMSRPPITRPPIVNPYLGTIVNLNPVVLNPNFQAGLMLRNM